MVDDAFHAMKSRGVLGHHKTQERPPVIMLREGEESDKRIIETSLAIVKEGNGQKLEDKRRLLVWSAADQKGVERLGKSYSQHFRQNSPWDRTAMDDLAYTLASRRSVLSWRSHLVTNEQSNGRIEINTLTATRASESPSLAFVFTGQGAQYAQMGTELLIYPCFKNSIIKSETELYKLGCSWALTGNSTQISGGKLAH